MHMLLMFVFVFFHFFFLLHRLLLHHFFHHPHHVLAGVFAIAAYLTGVLQESAFEDTSKEWVVETHETLGIVTAISIWVWFLFLSVKRLKRFSWLIGVITLVLVLVTGFYGGVLAHG